MEYLLKASAVIAIMYVCFYFFLKKETFFVHNRWFLLTGLVLALVFPLIVIPVYITVAPIANEVTTFISSTPSSFVATPPEVLFDWYKLIPILYTIGLIVFSIQFVFQFASLVLLLLKNPKQKDQHFTYVIVDNKISPFSFFKWIVYNPKSYKTEELKLILAHEKVHVNQLHSIDILLTQLVCVVFWLNPLIWLYRKEVRQNLEYIADFNSQGSSHSKKDYQHLLLKTSVANHDTILSNNFYNSSIKKRILMLNKSRSNKKNLWKYILMLPLLAGLLTSMNTEEIYIEDNSITIANENIIEFVVTKNTSDSELNTMIKAIKNKGGTLVFTQVDRNASNELINIFLKLNNHSYGGGNSQDPIDAFIIYKEFFGLGGGFVGRINGATLHYDNNEKIYDEKNSEELSHRAHKAILKAGIQTEEDLKKYKQQRANLKNKNAALLSTEKDTLHFTMIDSSKVQRLSKVKSDLYYEGGKIIKINDSNKASTIHQPATNDKIIFNSGNQNPKPLFVVNGKVVSSDYLKSISPENIESMSVLKDEKGINKYGEKGKNGVIELTTKESVIITKKDNLEQIKRSKLKSVTFIDDEDSSKNASIAYISKYTTDEVLEDYKSSLLKIGVIVKYSKLKRNKSGDITSIKISLKDENGSKSSATWKVTDGIPNIEFGKSEGILITRTKG